jgi:hypothetical protein
VVGSPAFVIISDTWQNGGVPVIVEGSDPVVKIREEASLTGIRKQKSREGTFLFLQKTRATCPDSAELLATLSVFSSKWLIIKLL